MNKKPKILIVDDVAQNLQLLTQMLKNDYRIIAATSGEKAIELCNKSDQPDIILLDVMMPKMDGYEVCKRLKNNPYTMDIPIIFVTSLNSIKNQEKALELGAVDYISKPISKNILLQRLRTNLKLNNLEKQYSDLNKMPQQTHERQQILIVDDTPQNIHILIKILEEQYTVNVANSGNKALELLYDGFIPDLILLDVLMPDINGFDVCKQLKQDHRYTNIPIIFVTVLEDEYDVIKGLELGAVDYITKPIEPTIVKARVQTHLKLKSFQDSLLEDIQKKDTLIIQQSKLATMGEMFENIIHQWKQPLSVISLTSGAIKMDNEFGTLDTDSLIKSLHQIEKSTQYLAQTVDDFRDFLKDDKQKQYFYIDTIINTTLNLIGLPNITITNNTPHKEILSYKNELIQILMNLFNNSKYALIENKINNPHIDIDCTIDNEIITIKITDNAGGVPQDIISNIFDKYFTTKGNMGSGLGLYMCKTIAIQHFNGSLEAQNISDGLCMTLSFPITEE